MATNVAEFPDELSAPLLAFVVLTGLDIVHNAIHKAIWDLLSNNRQPDRVPIQFRVLQGDHEYPKPKPKRSTYEWHVPKGILKVNWMNKHLYQIPALVVVFFDLDWDELAWSEKLMELCAKVQVVRAALEGRNTKIAVVLIQRNTPLPPGEDVIAAERATALCNTCDLSAKMLFVFPHTDHLFGYAIRLEGAFYELTQNYYQQQSRLVKAHREHLNKTTHQLLFVRHQFKIGIYNELKHDVPTALKHYKSAYANLMEVRTTDTNITEVKIVAGFINYKICKLCFKLNTPLDAISQFRKHIDIFKHRVGYVELAFEHSAWMAKQFSSFGDLFEEAIKLGLSAIQTQHPGFYYQQAAIHAMNRKKLCRRFCQNVEDLASGLLFDMDGLEYYGQRPWRPGVQSIEPPDQQMERDGIKALQCKEATQTNHPTLIIPLLSSAITQFKKYRCPRMKRYLVVQMGEEYYDAQDYGKALALLSHVSWDYRHEKWWNLLTNILMTAIKCAYLIASVQEYVTICLEVISPYINVNVEEKERVQRNLMTVMSDKIPNPEPDLNESVIRSTEHLWKEENAKIASPTIISLEINDIANFINCKAVFLEDSVCVDCPVVLKVYLRVSCPLPIRFTKLCVIFSNQVYNENCIITDSMAPSHLQNGYTADLLLEPGKTKVIPFTIVPLPKDVNQVLLISAVALQLGDQNTKCAILRWKVDQENNVVFTTSWNNTNWKQTKDSPDLVTGYPSIRIQPRESRLKIVVDHEAPALVNEYYPIKVSLHNQESTVVEDLILEVGFSEETPSAYLESNDPGNEKEFLQSVSIPLTALAINSQLERTVFLRASLEGSCTITVKIHYKIWLEVSGQNMEFECCNVEEILIPIVRPFDINVRTLSNKMESIDILWIKESFLIHIDIQSTSPWPLVLKSSRLKSEQLDAGDFTSGIDDIVVNSGDSASECHCLIAPETDDGLLVLGTYFLSWKRKSSGDIIPVVESSAVLPSLSVVHIPVSVSLNLPTHGWVRTPLTVSYHIQNRMLQVQEFDFCMEISDYFMYAGHKQVHFKILPQGNLILRYNLYPLVSGFVTLPKLRMLSHDSNYDSQVEGIIQKMVPTHIFIMPQSKRWPETGNEEAQKLEESQH